MGTRSRAELRGEKLRLVALTGYGGPEVVVRAKSAGFDLHAIKPFDPDLIEKLFGAL